MTKLYRVHLDNNTLQNLKEINFADHNFKERYDIQEWVESTPQILGEELLIIAKEKTSFNGTNERPDLIALDKSGNIVIIELKRDDSGVDVHWQAIKYASYWSKFAINNIINVYKDYLEKKDSKEYSEEFVQDKILDFIDEEDFDSLNNKQRIILTSHKFSKEVISALKWLIDEYHMNIKCVQLIPYFDSDMSIYNIMSNTLLPLPEIDDYIIKPLDRIDLNSQTKGAVRKNDEITFFVETIKEKIYNSSELKYKPNKNSRWAGVADTFRYYHFWYKTGYWGNWSMSYRIWKFNDKNDVECSNRFFMYLTFLKKELLSNGMTEVEFSNIDTFLKSVKIEGFQYEGNKDYCAIAKKYETYDLNDNMKNILTKDMVNLINSTKQKIDNICNSKK